MGDFFFLFFSSSSFFFFFCVHVLGIEIHPFACMYVGLNGYVVCVLVGMDM